MTTYNSRKHNPRYFVDATPRTQSPALSPNETLCGLEAQARAAWQEVVARGVHLVDGCTLAELATRDLTFVVTYHPARSYGYEFREPGGLLRGAFDNRDSCLEALMGRMEMQA